MSAARVFAVAAAGLAAGCAEPPVEPAAGARFAPPAGCALLATVQQRGCSTLQITRCEAAPAERVSHEFLDGALREVVTTRAGVETRIKRAGGSTLVVDRDLDDPGAPVDAALPGVRAEVRGLVRRPDGAVLAVVRERFSALGPAEIGGRKLVRLARETTFERDGRVETIAGEQFYDPALAAPVGHVIQAPGGATDRSPVSIALPGEPGFGALAPASGCVS